jgi:hypothetical protein
MSTEKKTAPSERSKTGPELLALSVTAEAPLLPAIRQGQVQTSTLLPDSQRGAPFFFKAARSWFPNHGSHTHPRFLSSVDVRFDSSVSAPK